MHVRESAPDGHQPSDVPEIRDWLLADLRDGHTGRALDSYAYVCFQMGRPAPTTTHAEIEGLEGCKLFWMPEAESEAIDKARAILPDDLILTHDFIPAPSGFAVLAKSISGTDSRTGMVLYTGIRAIAWHPYMLSAEVDERGWGVAGSPMVECVAISTYAWLPDINIEALNEHLIEANKVDPQPGGDRQLSKQPRVWMPLGRSDWEIDTSWKEHPFFKPDQANYKSMIEDRELVCAIWGLMGSCPPVQHHPSRAERRRAERRGSDPAPVQVITWHGPSRTTTASEGEGRHVSVRYHVSPFWRRQRYGPRNSKMKYVMIPGHWRGPADAPVSDPRAVVSKIVREK